MLWEPDSKIQGFACNNLLIVPVQYGCPHCEVRSLPDSKVHVFFPPKKIKVQIRPCTRKHVDIMQWKLHLRRNVSRSWNQKSRCDRMEC